MRIVWKNLPLEMHPLARPAALAAMAANEQGKFWAYHDKLFANQGKFARNDLVRYAREVGLDVKRFEQALDSKRYGAAIDADVAEARSIGITGTPAFFVDGHFLSGAKPYEDFAKLIDAELVRPGSPAPAPTPPSGS